LTRDELLADRTDDPALTPEQFETTLRLAVAEFKAGKLVRRKRRGRPARHRDFMSDNAGEFLTGANAAELLAGSRG
jgi:hypothetical protein